MKKKGNAVILLIVLIIMIIAIVGVSYAAFNYSRTGEKLNSITTGSVTMSYEESDNVINLAGALPTVDEAGKKRLKEGEYFDFSISSNIVGNININYEISAKDVTTSDRKIDGSNIKLYLTRLTDDGEEELMAPEVYNEEASENTYTGRPSNEMSLYASSMNSSESNNYRLRMWVDENYNPQGDGGNLQFSVQINVYGKSGDKMSIAVPAVELVKGKANPEDLDYNTATDKQKKEMWTFTQSETEQTEALIDYRYIGMDPNNYVEFNDELWRIVGVFTVDDGTGQKQERLKIVSAESIGRYYWNSNKSNDWTKSNLNSFLNSNRYWTSSLNEVSKEMIGDTKWYLGGASNYADSTASQWYSFERGTKVYSQRQNSWVGKVGLMYPSDYGYATSGGEELDRNSCLNKSLWAWDSNCFNNDWLSILDDGQWTITTHSDYSYWSIGINNKGNVEAFTVNTGFFNVKPCVYLQSNVLIMDGDGTKSNPYILSI